MNVWDVVKVIQDNDGQFAFHPDPKLPPEDFQVIVDRVLEAFSRGLIEEPFMHKSASTGLIDLVVATGPTKAGEAFLERA